MRKIDRRSFIRGAALGVTAASFAGSLTRADDRRGPLLVHGKGPLARKDLDRALALVLAPLGGMAAFVKRGQRVLLKPNLSFPSAPAARATTSPKLVAALVRQVQACSPKQVVVADYPCRDGDRIRTLNGYGEALAGLGAELKIASDERDFVEVEIPRGKALKKTKILKLALETDVHIAVPLAKSHADTLYTGVLKGMMGLIWDREIFHGPLDLHQATADLNTRLRPHLSILEGIEVMADNGPTGPGTLLAADSLIAGLDPVAVDAAGVALTPLFQKKVAPRNVEHLKLAAALGLGSLELPASEVRRIELV